MLSRRENVALEVEAARTLRGFDSIEELARRLPSLSRTDLATLAEVGALNSIGKDSIFEMPFGKPKEREGKRGHSWNR